mmetsp:Transcript_7297/g.24648  ORF Transcript_7297/g.24648 Transcript_7297/m.24648 type:complete len:309 (-) Transcript_7297:746-1672(-)
MAMRVHSASASTMECVVSSTRRLGFATFWRMAQICCLVSTSRPVVGSSSTTMAGSPTRAMPMLRRRRMPPLSESARVLNASPSRPTSTATRWASARTAAPRKPLARAMYVRCSETERNSHTTSSCVVMPMLACMLSLDTATSWPATKIWPCVGASTPVSAPMVVDFPAPFGPRRPTTSPYLMCSERSRTAVKGGAERLLYTTQRLRITTGVAEASAAAAASASATTSSRRSTRAASSSTLSASTSSTAPLVSPLLTRPAAAIVAVARRAQFTSASSVYHSARHPVPTANCSASATDTVRDASPNTSNT